MLDIDDTVYGTADDWFFLTAGDVAHHGDSDDAAFDRWLASLPEGGLDDALSGLHDGYLSGATGRGARRSVPLGWG